MKTSMMKKWLVAVFAAISIAQVCNAAGPFTWQLDAQNYPISAYQYDPVAYNGYVYVFGGWNGTALTNVYYAKANPDGTLGSWTPTTSLLEPAQGPGATVYNGWIYVALDSGNIYRARIKADGSLDSWIKHNESVPASTEYRLGFKAYKGHIYLLGGYNGSWFNTVRIAQINADGSLGSLGTTTPMPQPREHQAVHFFKDRVYIVAGKSAGVVAKSTYSAAINSDGSLAPWRQEADLPTTLWQFGSVIIGNQIVLFGGFTDNASGKSSTIYGGTISPADGKIIAWPSVGTMPDQYSVIPGAVYNESSANVYLIGGYNLSQFTRNVWRASANVSLPPHLQEGLDCAAGASNCLLDLFSNELVHYAINNSCAGLMLDESQVPDELCVIKRLQEEANQDGAIEQSIVTAISLIDSIGSCVCSFVPSRSVCRVFGSAVPFLASLELCINDMISQYNDGVCPSGNPLNCFNQGLVNDGYQLLNVEVLSPVDVKVTDGDGNELGVSQSDNLPYSDLQTPGWIWRLTGEHQLAMIKNPSGIYTISIEGAANAGIDSTFGLLILNPKGIGISDEVQYSNVPTRPGALGSIALGPHTTDYSLSVDLDGDGTIDAVIQPDSVRTLTPDHDLDGVPDSADRCPETQRGSTVSADGCSIDQLVPCAGPASGGKWKNHGKYVSAVAHESEKFLAVGLITQAQKDAIVAAAAKSNCGKK